MNRDASSTAGEARAPARDPECLTRLDAIPHLPLWTPPTPLEEMARLRDALGGGPRLLVKRDDAISFGFGGNKVRKLELVLPDAIAADADTLVTVGSVQSNHARATAAAAAKLGLDCRLILNGTKPESPTANALLDELLGAEITYIATRAERDGAMQAAARRLRDAGKIPYPVPLGASTPLGALGFARAIGELLEQTSAPDVIVHGSSSGGTQAGLVAGCAMHGIETRVIGVSADAPAAEIEATVRRIVTGMGELLDCDGGTLADRCRIEVDDGFIGDRYAQPSPASEEAQRLAARTEALFIDHSYTAKALAALIAYVRAGRFDADQTVLFWHTGGQVGLFA